MPLMLVLLSIALISPAVIPASHQQWNRYIPEKQRKGIFKKAIKSTGMGAALSGRAAACTWLTEQVARALISDAVDRERLTPDEAEVKYRLVRSDDSYSVLIGSMGIRATTFGAYTTKTEIHPSEAFLQRSDDRENFSKGEVREGKMPFYLRGWEQGTFTLVKFSRLNSNVIA